SGVGSTTIGANLPTSYVIGTTPTLTTTSLRIALTSTQTSLNPGDGVTITAQMKDANGNNLLTGAYTIAFASSGGTSTGSLSSTLNLGLGVYTSVFTGNVAGTATTVTANSSLPYAVNSTVAMTVIPWNIIITSPKTTFAINEMGPLTGRVKDWQGNFVTTGGKGLSLALTSSGTGAISSTVDNSDGTYVANFAASAVGTTSATASMTQSFTVSSAPTLTVEKIHITVTLAAASVFSGSNVVATATLRNGSGQLVTGTGYTISFSTSGGGSTVTSVSAVSEVSTGVYQTTYQGVLAGAATTVSASSSQSYQLTASASLTVVPSSNISSSLSTLTISSSTVRSNQAVNLTAVLKDAAGNLVPGLTGVTLTKSSGAGIGTGTFSGVTDSGNGTYTAGFTGLAQGATAVTIGVSSNSVAVAQTVSVTVTSGVVSKLTLNGPTNVDSNACSTALSLAFYDGASNATTLSNPTSFNVTNLGNGGLYSDSACVTPIATVNVASGLSQSQNFYFKSFSPGAYALAFSASGITQTNSTYSLAVAPVLSWLGVTGLLDAYGSGQFYVAGIRDGSFNSVQGITLNTSGGRKYLYVSDYGNSVIQKFDVTDINAISMVGAVGRLGPTQKAVPTGGTDPTYCSGLAPSAGISGAWCKGGQYAAANGDAFLSSPYRTTHLTLGGVNYM
ncbi:MAG: hypothetical protein EOP50_07760, partial [Sphingobacteriales bacterium]